MQEEDKEISETDDDPIRQWKLRRLNSILRRKRALDVDKDNLNMENDYYTNHFENMQDADNIVDRRQSNESFVNSSTSNNFANPNPTLRSKRNKRREIRKLVNDLAMANKSMLDNDIDIIKNNQLLTKTLTDQNLSSSNSFVSEEPRNKVEQETTQKLRFNELIG